MTDPELVTGQDSGFLKQDDLLPLIEKILEDQKRSLWFWENPDPGELYSRDMEKINTEVQNYCTVHSQGRNYIDLKAMMNTCISNLYKQDKNKENIKTFFNGFNRKILNNVVLDFLLNIFVNIYNSIKDIIGFKHDSLIKISIDLAEVIKTENEKYEKDNNKIEVKVMDESKKALIRTLSSKPQVQETQVKPPEPDQTQVQETQVKPPEPAQTQAQETQVKPPESEAEKLKKLYNAIEALTLDMRDMESRHDRFVAAQASQDKNARSTFSKEIIEKIREWSTSKKFDAIKAAIDELQWKGDIRTAAEWGPQLADHLSTINSLVLEFSEYMPLDQETLVDLAKGVGEAIQGPDHGAGLMAVKNTLTGIGSSIKTRIRMGKEEGLKQTLGKEILDKIRINSFNQVVANDNATPGIKEKVAKWLKILDTIKVATDNLKDNIDKIPEEEKEQLFYCLGTIALYLIPVLSEQVNMDQVFQSWDVNNPSPSFQTIDDMLNSDEIVKNLEIINGALERTAQKKLTI